MYPRNAASPERIAVGAVVQISDGAVQGSAVTITVRGQAGAEGAGGGTTVYGASGIVYYTPTQAETDFTSFVVIASKTGCIPVAQTIVTSASATPGYAGTDQGKIANPTSTVALTGTTIATTQKVDVETIKTQAVTCAAGVTVLASVGTAATSTAQTGDGFARLGAPAGASVSADMAAVKVDTAAILVDTGTTLDGRIPAALTAGGNMKSDVLAVDGATDAADRLQKVVQGNVFCTVGAASTTTNIVTSAMDPAAAVIDQFKGRIVTFKNDTTTANLRGQSTDITASSVTGELTVTALTTAPASGDVFTVS